MNALSAIKAVGGDIVDGDAIAIGELYERSNSSLADAVVARLECGRRLAEKKASLAHGEWLPWLDDNAGVLGFSGERKAQKLMRAFKANTSPVAHLNDADIIKISRQMWGHDLYRAHGTGNNEWFSPPEYIELVREVMGAIDLDPASSAEANQVVGATRFFTIDDDGLSRDWGGRVWLNPPYSRDQMPKFVEKLKVSFQSGDVSAAIMVSHNTTDTRWFHSLTEVIAAICFPSKRIKFYHGDEVAAPVAGQMFAYLGDDVSAFKRVFAPVGYVVAPA